jgi:cell division protein FtsN
MVKASLGVVLAALMLGGCVYEQSAARDEGYYREDRSREDRAYRPSREVRETELPTRAVREPTPITGPAARGPAPRAPAMLARAPEPDRMRAEDLGRLAPGTGIAGPEAEPERHVRRTPNPSSRLFVQAASFVSREEAERARRSLTGLGRAGVYTAYVDDQLRYRVRIGPLATRERGERVRAAVARRGYGDAIIIRD